MKTSEPATFRLRSILAILMAFLSGICSAAPAIAPFPTHSPSLLYHSPTSSSSFFAALCTLTLPDISETIGPEPHQKKFRKGLDGWAKCFQWSATPTSQSEFWDPKQKGKGLQEIKKETLEIKKREIGDGAFLKTRCKGNPGHTCEGNIASTPIVQLHVLPRGDGHHPGPKSPPPVHPRSLQSMERTSAKKAVRCKGVPGHGCRFSRGLESSREDVQNTVIVHNAPITKSKRWLRFSYDAVHSEKVKKAVAHIWNMWMS
jgi:hypothetical protein